MYDREKYVEIQDEVIVEMRNMISYMNTNRQITAESVFSLKEDQRNIEYYIELPAQIKESITQHKAYATSDASMKGEKMGRYQLITYKKKQKMIQITLSHKR